jgi:hypothetical protein
MRRDRRNRLQARPEQRKPPSHRRGGFFIFTSAAGGGFFSTGAPPRPGYSIIISAASVSNPFHRFSSLMSSLLLCWLLS